MKKLTRKQLGILIAILVVVLCGATAWSIKMISSRIEVTNILDEYYLDFPSRLQGLTYADNRDLLGDEDVNYEKIYDMTYAMYESVDCDGLPEDCRIRIVVNRRKFTVKFIAYDGTYWYRYVYNAKEKKLTYGTNNRTSEERKDFLFTFVLPKLMEEHVSDHFSIDRFGTWDGEQP